MPQAEVTLVDAFVEEGGGGNAAGVVLDGDRWSPEQRQAIAARVGLSETAFVCASSSEDFRLRFHTPTRAIPHCGHATVASVALMAELGRLGEGFWRNETVDGPRRVQVAPGKAFLEQPRPRMDGLDAVAWDRLLRGLGLAAEALKAEPLRAHNGNGTLLVPLREEALLAALAPDMGSLKALSEELDVVGVYAFAEDEEGATARMFAPAYGIDEEAATGMMAGPLGHWLSTVAGRAASGFRIVQGRFMTPPSPSRLQIRLDGDSIWVGGAAKARERRLVEFP